MAKMVSLFKCIRLRYEVHMKYVRDKRAREDYVREEGYQEGLREARQEGLIQIAQRMLAKGVPMEDIIAYTGLTEDVIACAGLTDIQEEEKK